MKKIIVVISLMLILIAGIAFADKVYYHGQWVDPQKARMWQIEDEAKAKIDAAKAKDSNEFNSKMAEIRNRKEEKKQAEQAAREKAKQDKLASMTPIERRIAVLEDKVEKLEKRISALENPINQPVKLRNDEAEKDTLSLSEPNSSTN
jgi:hypothetical protein